MAERGKPDGGGGTSGWFRPYLPGESRATFAAAPSKVHLAPIDHRCLGTIPGHELHVLNLMQDQYALRIEYEITPALPAEPCVSWSWSA
jgi:hypothetical protein